METRRRTKNLSTEDIDLRMKPSGVRFLPAICINVTYQSLEPKRTLGVLAERRVAVIGLETPVVLGNLD